MIMPCGRGNGKPEATTDVTAIQINSWRNFDDRVEPRGVRLRHAPKSGFGQFNHSILMADEIQAGVENKPIDRRRRRNQGWRVRRFVRRACAVGT